MIIVILCGGAGTRLWPVSRHGHPKQFSAFIGTETLYEATVRRNLPLSSRFLVVTNRDHLELARGQFKAAVAAAGATATVTFILEPCGRNTAPAVAFAALETPEREIMVVVPSDHVIANEQAYQEAVLRAEAGARQGRLVTFGLKPTAPETGYGYIEGGSEADTGGLRPVLSFKEKPVREKAEEYLRRGNYYWNSGMYVFSREAILAELGTAAPTILRGTKAAWEAAIRTPGELRIGNGDMLAIPSQSIDYAVMEKSGLVSTLPVELGWSDLGSFDAIYETRVKDISGNAADPGTILVEAKGCLVIGSGKQVAIAGLDDVVVVVEGDSVLVTRRGRTQLVKDVTSRL